MSKPNTTGKQRVQQNMRVTKAMDLRAKGHTWAEIAKLAGYNRMQSAQAAVKLAMDRQEHESADNLRAVELARLERLHRAWYSKALDGDKDAAGVILRTSERRCKLMGLDAPTLLQAVPPTMTREEAEAALLERLGRLPAITHEAEEVDVTAVTVVTDARQTQEEQ